MEKWQESLGLRLSIFIMFTTMMLFAITIAVCVYQANKMTTDRTVKYTGSQMNNTVEFINDNLYGVEQTVKNYATNAQYYTSTPEGCYKLCDKIVHDDSTICAATIMVRHDYYPNQHEGHHLFAPAVAHEPGTNIYEPSNLVANSDDDFQYEKTDSNWIWTNRLNDGYWCEPYQDVYHTHDFLVTYSYPLHEKDGSIYAILCADIRLSLISEHLNNTRPTPHSRLLLITRNSHFLVHPQPQFVEAQGENLLAPSVAEVMSKTKVDTTVISLYHKMLAGDAGSMTIKRPCYFTMSGVTDTIPEGFVLYSPVKASGWSLASVCPKSDIDAESNSLVGRILISSFAGLILMALALLYMVRKMVSPYKEFAAVDADIKTAANIQSSMISTVFPMEHNMKGKQLYASMTPAKSIGGDLYDYHLDGDNLTIIVGDVSGKGVPAAFFMASALTLFRVFANRGAGPAQILTEINNALSRDNETMMFVTAFAAKVNLQTGKMTFCNGGHNAPVLIQNEKAHFLKVMTNLPLGVMEDMPYEEESLDLKSGDTFVVYTDGVTEAEDIQGNLYGDDHLLKFLSGRTFATANALCTNLAEDVHRHADTAEQSDDITMMCLKF